MPEPEKILKGSIIRSVNLPNSLIGGPGELGKITVADDVLLQTRNWVQRLSPIPIGNPPFNEHQRTFLSRIALKVAAEEAEIEALYNDRIAVSQLQHGS